MSPEPSARAVVSALTGDEEEYERCQGLIVERRRRVAELQAELTTLRSSLERFAAHCHARMGDLLDELRRITRAIANHERTLGRSSEDPVADEIHLNGTESLPFDRWGETMGDQAPTAAPSPTDRAGAVDSPDAAALKRTYLELAKQWHPDLAQTPAERHMRERLMQRINEAFRDRDLPTLRWLGREAEAADPSFRHRPVRERLAWTRIELVRLNQSIADLRGQLTSLRASEAHALWRRHVAGEPIMEMMEDDLEARLVAEGKRLDTLIAAYRQLLDHRSAP